MSEADRERWNARHGTAPPHEPEEVVVRWLPRVLKLTEGTPRLALDVACGKGRHALLLAREGFDVLALDVSDVAVEHVAEAARRAHLPVLAQRFDVEGGLPLPHGFQLVLCVHFLHRPLWPELRAAVAPGGLLLFQTFTAGESERSGFPRRFCLEEGELSSELAPPRAHGFEVLEHEIRDDGRLLESVLARRT